MGAGFRNLGRLEMKLRAHPLRESMLAAAALRCTTCSAPLTPHTFNPIKPLSSSSSSYIHHYPQIPNQWSGLHNWRHGPPNHDRFWGPIGPEVEPPFPGSPGVQSSVQCPVGSGSSLAEIGSLVLSTADPLRKSKLSHLGYCRWSEEGLPIGACQPPDKPARPPLPNLVSPKEIPSHKQLGLPLNAYMLHNLAHVELNAIDLAWDTVVRFSPYLELLGEGFFADFAHVADDESRHFAWCSQRLAELGFKYGDIPAHNLLWRECDKTSRDVAARLAAIPLVQEARGLDAGPRLVQKLIGFGDHRTAGIVARIAAEEVAHVAVGVYWFSSVCQKMNCPPCNTFKDLLKEYDVELKGPFNYTARDEAGIPREWYDSLSLKKEKDQTPLSQIIEDLLLEEVVDMFVRLVSYESDMHESPCSICLGSLNYKTGDELGELHYCFHSFHYTCMSMALQRANKCPLCTKVWSELLPA